MPVRTGRLASWGWELLFAGLVAYVAWPLWTVDYLPIQDLPQHLAAIRVLHSHGDAAYGFARFFELDLTRTQYLTYYVVADLLAYVMDVERATRVLLTATVCATPYALRSLLRALQHDERYALLALPLAYNAHLVLGFLNFLAAVPLMAWGLASAVRLRMQFTRVRAVGLAALCLLTFYTHVVPFALMALGVLGLSLGRDLRPTLRRVLTLVPVGLTALVWTLYSPAGRATLSAASDGVEGARPAYRSSVAAFNEAPGWLTDVFSGHADVRVLVAWVLLVLSVLAIGAGTATGAASTSQPSVAGLRMRVALLAPVAALAYFVLPTSYDWIWPIAPRFALLTGYLLIPLLPVLPRIPAVAVAAAACLLSVAHVRATTTAFRGFAGEVGDLDAALDSIPEGRRVAGLIWQRGSRHVKFSPFIHSVAYYQARKGGAVMFTFADFPQSPFRFRADARPPQVPPRWEWKPEAVDPVRDLTWYDYVLVRGGPGAIGKASETFRPVYRGQHWRVYQRL